MKPGLLLTFARGALGAGIFACAALAIEYQNAAAGLCGADGACAHVRESALGKGIEHAIQRVLPTATLPQVALFAFVALLSFTFFVKSKLHIKIAAGLAAFGALAAIGLIGAQIIIGHICPYCMVVDVAMLAAAGALIVLARQANDPDGPIDSEWIQRMTSTRLTLLWGGAGALFALTPYVWPLNTTPTGMPPEIAALQQPGKTVIVSFTDFQCPHCRKVSPTLKELEKRPNTVLHRYMVPLPFHPGAMPAALAYVCTPAEQRDVMVEALYAGTAEQLTPDGVILLAESAGVADLEAFRTCVQDPATKERVEGEKSLFFDKLGGEGLPTTYIGKVQISGSAVKEGQKFDQRLIDAYDKGAVPAVVRLPVWTMFVAVAGMLVAATFFTLRWMRDDEAAAEKARRKRDEQEEPVDEDDDDDDAIADDDSDNDDEPEADEDEPKPAKKTPSPKKKGTR